MSVTIDGSERGHAMRYENQVESFEDPKPNRLHEERASRRILFALLVAGAVVAGLYGLGLVLASSMGGV